MTVFTPEVIASWPKPNYVNPVSLDTPIYAVNGVCIALSTLAIAGRFYSRVEYMKQRPGLDDYTMLIAYLFCIALMAIHATEPRYGVGRHIYDMPLSNAPIIGKIALAKQIILTLAVVITKISICFTYLNLFPLATSKIFCYTIIAILTAFAITNGILVGVQCKHIEDTWELFNYNSSCINRSVFYNWQTAMNMLLDLVVFLWPIKYLWAVQMPRDTRLALIACFSCGVMICAIALARVVLTIRYYETWDLTWNGAVIYILVSVEVSLGIICGSVPSVRPLFRRHFNPATTNHSSKMTPVYSSENRRRSRKPDVWELEDNSTEDIVRDIHHDARSAPSLESEIKPYSHIRNSS